MAASEGRVDRVEQIGRTIAIIFIGLLALMFAYGYLGWIIAG
jgi:hypothetical protein